jgi:hypothetical protein
VQQGLLEVYEPAADEFGSLDVSSLREAAAGTEFTRAQMMQRLRTAQDELTRAVGALDYDNAQLVVRMVDIRRGFISTCSSMASPIRRVSAQHGRGARGAAGFAAAAKMR